MKLIPEKNTIFSLTIGTSCLTLGYLDYQKDRSSIQMEVLNQAIETEGINPLSEAVLRLIERAEKLFNCDISQIILQVPDRLLKTHHYLVDISIDATKPISERELAVLNQNAQKNFRITHSELLFKNALHYRVDQDVTLSDPKGLFGSRLEAEFLGIYANHQDLLPYIRLCNACGLQVVALRSSIINAADRFVLASDRRDGSALVKFGRTSSTVIVFKDQLVDRLFHIPLGSQHITNDLAQGLRVDRVTAEQIKVSFGIQGEGYPSSIPVKDIDQVDRLILWRDAAEIIGPRVREFAVHLAQGLRPYKGSLQGGVVLYGGGAVLRGMADYLSENLRIQTRLASQILTEACPDVELRIHRSIDAVDPTTRFADTIGLLYSERTELVSRVSEQSAKPYQYLIKNFFGWVRELG